MVKDDHVYTLNHDVKPLCQNQDRKNPIVVKASSNYHINENKTPIKYKMIETIDDVLKIVSEIKATEPHKEIKVKGKGGGKSTRKTEREQEQLKAIENTKRIGMELRAKVLSGEIKLGPKLSDVLSGEVKLGPQKENVIINLILKGDDLTKFLYELKENRI
jgi:hypothetical protein